MRRETTQFLLLLLLTAASSRAADFDFYVLALSWSPEYCEASGSRDHQQCGPGRRLGFVLHGLWPQQDKGYPSNCGGGRLSNALKAKFPGLYPNDRLYDHEWEKHGTCSGLSPERYLSLSRTLKESVRIPEAFRTPAKPIRMTVGELRHAFSSANPQIGEGAVAVSCSGSGRFLSELYVCFSRDGKPIACSREIQSRAARSCGQPTLLIRNVR